MAEAARSGTRWPGTPSSTCSISASATAHRATGELLAADKYVPVNWASHIDPASGRPVEAAGARYPAGQPFMVQPSQLGGHNWQPMAWNPVRRSAAWRTPHAGPWNGGIPDLRHSPYLAEASLFRRPLVEGLLATRGMPSFTDTLAADDADAIRAYVVRMAHITRTTD